MQRQPTKRVIHAARALGAFRTSTLPGGKLADGSFALDAEQESERWNEHLAALLCGGLVDTFVEPPVHATPATHDVDETLAAIGTLTENATRDHKQVHPTTGSLHGPHPCRTLESWS